MDIPRSHTPPTEVTTNAQERINMLEDQQYYNLHGSFAGYSEHYRTYPDGQYATGVDASGSSAAPLEHWGPDDQGIDPSLLERHYQTYPDEQYATGVDASGSSQDTNLRFFEQDPQLALYDFHDTPPHDHRLDFSADQPSSSAALYEPRDFSTQQHNDAPQHNPREQRVAPPRYAVLRNEARKLRDHLKQMHPDLTIPYKEKDDRGNLREYRTVKKVWEKATEQAERQNKDLSATLRQLDPDIQQAIQRKTRRPRA